MYVLCIKTEAMNRRTFLSTSAAIGALTVPVLTQSFGIIN
jgi:hypothetical protein